MRRNRLITGFLVLTLAAALCVSVATDREQTGSTGVSGLIRGTEVELTRAEYDGTLSIFQGDGWGQSPSLLLFMFFGSDEVPSGRTIEIAVADRAQDDTPHVHYRWQNEAGEIQAEAVVHHYRMRLTFGELEGDVLPGSIEFSVPGEQTRVSGEFRATLESKEPVRTAPHHSNRKGSALRSSSKQLP